MKNRYPLVEMFLALDGRGDYSVMVGTPSRSLAVCQGIPTQRDARDIMRRIAKHYGGESVDRLNQLVANHIGGMGRKT